MANISDTQPVGSLSNSTAYCEKLKKRYIQFQGPKHHVTQYVRLALILETDVTPGNKCLDKLTELTLRVGVDVIHKKKEPLNGLQDIFHYQDQPCPRLVLIIGGPGKNGIPLNS